LKSFCLKFRFLWKGRWNGKCSFICVPHSSNCVSIKSTKFMASIYCSRTVISFRFYHFLLFVATVTFISPFPSSFPRPVCCLYLLVSPLPRNPTHIANLKARILRTGAQGRATAENSSSTIPPVQRRWL
jgi:hypothetical protein